MPSVLDLAKLEDRRRALIRFIEQYTPQGSSNNRVTVVFDGNLEVFGGMKSSAAKIVFSQGESADDTIKKIVAQAQNTKNIIVVSDDRAIQYAVRALGAKTSGAKAFIVKAKIPRKQQNPVCEGSRRARKSSTNGSPAESQKYISKTEESKITSEFGEIWLNSDKKRKKQS
jgi:predicted RNA-binding protein with PIN domain